MIFASGSSPFSFAIVARVRLYDHESCGLFDGFFQFCGQLALLLDARKDNGLAVI